MDIELHGMFRLSAAQSIARHASPEEAQKWFWQEYDLFLPADSKESLINGVAM